MWCVWLSKDHILSLAGVYSGMRAGGGVDEGREKAGGGQGERWDEGRGGGQGEGLQVQSV